MGIEHIGYLEISACDMVVVFHMLKDTFEVSKSATRHGLFGENFL
ncbi:MAG: hypothetical protein ABI356_12875 [Steroidobacteraceae bacterium]